VPFWRDGSPEETAQGYLLAPEYKGSTRADYPGNRVRNGDLAQQWFHSFGNFEAGILQQVTGVTPGVRLRLEWWALAWSCDNESKGNCEGATSGDPSPMHLRIGIDPTGGTDYRSENIVWSPEQDAYDAWFKFEVEAVARASSVTVFFYSYPDYRSQDNNVYVDDASLTVVAPPPTSTRRPATATPLPPTATATPTETTTPTEALPTETPTATATERPTETSLPTETPLPTDTPAPTATNVPTDTPVPTTVVLTATIAPSATSAPVIPTAAPTTPSRKGLGRETVSLVIYGVVLAAAAVLWVLLWRRRKAR
jgi:hypothetical protein